MQGSCLSVLVALLLIVCRFAGAADSGLPPHCVSYSSATPNSFAGLSNTQAMNNHRSATVVRLFSGMTSEQVSSTRRPSHQGGARVAADSTCLSSLAWSGQPAPNTGGWFQYIPTMGTTTINSSGRIAFVALVDGSSRNQGVFVADSSGVSAIAIGCGSGGGSGEPGAGCGDPSPIGGTFSGFFLGCPFAPAINDAGDVLFLCDVDGGHSPRGLFLYRAATKTITKVAAVGDPSPLGGTFDAIGPGSLNYNGKVVFLASPPGWQGSAFLWEDGVVTKVAAVGDPAPGGGVISVVGAETFNYRDGTSIPIGPVPDINDSDQISYCVYTQGGTPDGIIVRTRGVDEWYVRVPDSTPAGGTYVFLAAPSLNNQGQIAFSAFYDADPMNQRTGWFAGAPGNWRKVVAFYDSLDGGECHGLAWSRNPMQTIDEDGNVLFWTGLGNWNDPRDRLVMGLKDGGHRVLARRDDPAQAGGVFGVMDPWPSLNGSAGTLNADTTGGAGPAAHMRFWPCRSLPRLQSFGSRWNGQQVEVSWQFAEVDDRLNFDIARQELPLGSYEPINSPAVRRSDRTFFFDDASTEPGKSYRYRVVVFRNGERVTSFETEVTTPAALRLHPNMPNPFNGVTRVDFSIDREAHVNLAIYDVSGRCIRTLLHTSRPVGSHNATWDGRDDGGDLVASGIYTIVLTSGGRDLRQKCVFLK